MPTIRTIYSADTYIEVGRSIHPYPRLKNRLKFLNQHTNLSLLITFYEEIVVPKEISYMFAV